MRRQYRPAQSPRNQPVGPFACLVGSRSSVDVYCEMSAYIPSLEFTLRCRYPTHEGLLLYSALWQCPLTFLSRLPDEETVSGHRQFRPGLALRRYEARAKKKTLKRLNLKLPAKICSCSTT